MLAVILFNFLIFLKGLGLLFLFIKKSAYIVNDCMVIAYVKNFIMEDF